MKAKKVLAIISFTLVMSALLFVIITDISIFYKAILAVVGGIIVSIFAFFFLFIFMILSIVLVFGVFIIKEYGFWPLNFSLGLFKEVLGGIEISSEQMGMFVIFRIIVLVILVATLIMSCIAKHRSEEIPKPPLRGMSVAATVLSIMGIVSGFIALLITAQIG